MLKILVYIKNLLINPIKIRVVYIVIVIFSIFLLNKGCHKPENNHSESYSTVESKKDKQGIPYTVVRQEVLTKKDMDNLTDSIRKSIKGKPQIKEVIKYINTVDTVVVTKTLTIDSSNKSISDYYRDKNINISYLGNLDNNTGTFKFFLTPDTVTTITTLKKHFFKADENEVIFRHSNDLVKTTKALSYSYKTPKILFVVSVGGYYDIFRNQWGFGIQGGIPLIMIKKNK